MNNKQFGRLQALQAQRKKQRRFLALWPAGDQRTVARYIIRLQGSTFGRIASMLRKPLNRTERKARKLHRRRADAFFDVRGLRPTRWFIDEYNSRYLTPSSIEQMMKAHGIGEYDLIAEEFDGFTLYVPAEHVEAVNDEVQARRCVGQQADVKPLSEVKPYGVKYLLSVTSLPVQPPVEVIAPKPEDVCPIHNRLCVGYDPTRYNKWE